MHACMHTYVPSRPITLRTCHSGCKDSTTGTCTDNDVVILILGRTKKVGTAGGGGRQEQQEEGERLTKKECHVCVCGVI